MRSVRFDAHGFSRTYWEFYVGFGLFVSVFLVFAAVLAWQLGDLAPETLALMRGPAWARVIGFAIVITVCLTAAAWLSAKRSVNFGWETAGPTLDGSAHRTMFHSPRAPWDWTNRVAHSLASAELLHPTLFIYSLHQQPQHQCRLRNESENLHRDGQRTYAPWSEEHKPANARR
jgi:hypothetical protein